MLCAIRIGQIEQVLVERDGRGRTEQFIPISVADAQPGDLLSVRVTAIAADGLVGEALRDAA
jgi:threonylcarbamoyladenosine tRNA methylthiotransferase MtaB